MINKIFKHRVITPSHSTSDSVVQPANQWLSDLTESMTDPSFKTMDTTQALP